MRRVVAEAIFDALDCPVRREADRGSGGGHYQRPMTLRRVLGEGGGVRRAGTMIWCSAWGLAPGWVFNTGCRPRYSYGTVLVSSVV